MEDRLHKFKFFLQFLITLLSLTNLAAAHATASLSLSTLITLSPTTGSNGPLFKNVIPGDVDDISSVTLNFNSDNACNTFLGQKQITGGSVNFNQNVTVHIRPSSVYEAAVNVGVDTANIHSVTVLLRNSSDALFLNGSSFPCVQIICTGNNCYNTNSPEVIEINTKA